MKNRSRRRHEMLFCLGPKRKGGQRKTNRLTTSLGGLEDNWRRLRYCHATEIYRGSWSVAQVCCDPTTTLDHEVDNDDDDDEIFYGLISRSFWNCSFKSIYAFKRLFYFSLSIYCRVGKWLSVQQVLSQLTQTVTCDSLRIVSTHEFLRSNVQLRRIRAAHSNSVLFEVISHISVKHTFVTHLYTQTHIYML